jgi:hypothetical protein
VPCRPMAHVIQNASINSSFHQDYNTTQKHRTKSTQVKRK